MCGIAGIIQFDNRSADLDRTRDLTRALAHRGPDDEGFVARGPAVLGHRRLSIIDLEGGKQPLSNADGTMWIACNGELYNYRELRADLKARGHAFRTASDTEVILQAYEEWGEACLDRFRGMFAFAILDERRQRMFLARDHFGIKPLYYVHTAQLFAFASELHALKRLPDVSWTIDLQSLDDYLAFQYVPSPATIYATARKLPPASRLTARFDGRVSPPETYWTLQFKPDLKRSQADTLHQLDAVIRDSVRAHVVADVPFGAFLSGGVDSSTVVACMAELLDQPVRTFSIGFPETDQSELGYARQVAAAFGTDHHEEIVQPDALAILPNLVRHYGEPFGDHSAVPTYYVSRMARGLVPMVLSGDGGDESFAGYDDTYMPWMQHLAASAPGTGPNDVSAQSVEQYLPFVSSSPRWRQALWRPEFNVVREGAPPLFCEAFEHARDLAGCAQAQSIDLRTYLPHSVLTKVDVASMMHGLEVRTPLVDKHVVEFAATIPTGYNVVQLAGQWAGKMMLKKVAARWFDSAFLNRPKRGFGLPLGPWLQSGGAFASEVAERLRDPVSPLCEYFRPEQLDDLVSRKAENLVWRLLFLDEWLRQNRRT
jgi:asparagine synthase (glutamine-hydrolysing)